MCDFNDIYNRYKKSWQYRCDLKDVKVYEPDKIGVYRAKLNGEVVYVGKAVEANRGTKNAHCWGLHKRLCDYIRSSPSSRETGAGPDMYLHRNEIEIETIEFDYSDENASLVSLLERLFIYSLKPLWNKD